MQASVPKKGKPPAKEVEITLGGTGTVKGVVTDGSGTAVAGAVVVGGAIALVAVLTGEEDDVSRGAVVFSIDGNNAWRDAAVLGGRR